MLSRDSQKGVDFEFGQLFYQRLPDIPPQVRHEVIVFAGFQPSDAANSTTSGDRQFVLRPASAHPHPSQATTLEAVVFEGNIPSHSAQSSTQRASVTRGR